MSNASVGTRIQQITSHEWFYTHYLFAPVVTGAVLAAVAPYINLLLSIIHKWAMAKQRAAEKANLLEEYEFKKLTADKKAEAENADKIALATQELILEQQKQLIEREKLDTKSLSDSKALLENEVDTLESAVRKQKVEREALTEQIDKILEQVCAIEDLIYESSSNELSQLDFSNKIKALVHPSLLEDARKRHVNNNIPY